LATKPSSGGGGHKRRKVAGVQRRSTTPTQSSGKVARSRSTTPPPPGPDWKALLSAKNSKRDLKSTKEMNDIKKKNLEMDLQLKTMEAERMTMEAERITNNLRMENIGRVEALKGEPNFYSKEKALAFFPHLGEIINIVYD